MKIEEDIEGKLRIMSQTNKSGIVKYYVCFKTRILFFSYWQYILTNYASRDNPIYVYRCWESKEDVLKWIIDHYESWSNGFEKGNKNFILGK